jgi:hypothetical protein
MLDMNWILALGLLLGLGALALGAAKATREVAEQEARKRMIPIRVRASSTEHRR